MTLWLRMSGKRNVSVCRGHELANALYPHKISSPLLKWLRRLNDFSNVKLIPSNIQAEIVRLSSIFGSHFTNGKLSQMWNRSARWFQSQPYVTLPI